MDYAEAKHQLLLHGSGTTDPTGQPLVLSDGFLASLRPYSGLHERNFHLVMEALLTVGQEIHRAQQVDRDLIQSVWSMCSTARAWGLHREGMLQRNKLITAEDTARLERWVNTIELTTLRLLTGWRPHWAVSEYAQYLVSYGWSTNIAFFVHQIELAVADLDIADLIEIMVDALGKLGGLASTALPTLREAQKRAYTWYTPEERCTEEVRGRIRQAIQVIESASDRV